MERESPVTPDPGMGADAIAGAPVAALGDGSDPDEVSSGARALELIRHQTLRLGRLQPEVLADQHPEPLHQLRVSLRRLRTALRQFAPALCLPESADPARIAAVARRTSLTRDCDVLRLRLEERLLPLLDASEREAMAPALKRLRRDRAEAFDTLAEALRAPRYLKLLARLHRWQQQPRFTDLGEQPIRSWLFEWQAPFTAGLFLEPGWTARDPGDVSLHELRKRIKGARYALEHLEPWFDPSLQEWIVELRQAQDHLGDLHDLQVLEATLGQASHPLKLGKLPTLLRALRSQQREHWQQWRLQAERLFSETGRHAFQRHLLTLGRTGVPQSD